MVLKRIVTDGRQSGGWFGRAVVTGTGSLASSQDPAHGHSEGHQIAHDVDEAVGERVTEAAVPGGLFVDQGAAHRARVVRGRGRQGVRAPRGPEGYLFDDVFPSVAVSFARYC